MPRVTTPNQLDDTVAQASSAMSVLNEVSAMPRTQSGPSPQHLLVTLFGDFWLAADEPLPSAAIAELMGEFGFSDSAARTALSRLARRGALAQSRDGRRTLYMLTPEVSKAVMRGGRRIAEFALPQPAWDGRWTVAAFEVPAERRRSAHVLRTNLKFHGFGPLLAGVWIAPRARPEDVLPDFRHHGIEQAIVMRSEVVPGPMSPLSAWDLDDVRAEYTAFIERYEPVLERLHSGGLSSAESLRTRVSVMDDWRLLPGIDPGVPEEALPDDWPRARASALFIELYDTMAPAARDQVRELLERHDPRLPDHVVVRSVHDLTALE